MHHPSALRVVECTSTKVGRIFTSHYNKGAVQAVKIWNLECKEGTSVDKSVL